MKTVKLRPHEAQFVEAQKMLWQYKIEQYQQVSDELQCSVRRLAAGLCYNITTVGRHGQ